MRQPHPAATKRAAPRLYLVSPPLDGANEFGEAIGKAIEAADVAAVLLRLPPGGERELINRVKSIASIVQPKGIALLLDGHAEIVARSGGDGAHMNGIDAFTAAIEGLKPARIVGCGGLKTRHDAMLAAERGADYVMFGEPEASGRRPSFPAVAERIEWWAELVEIPCVGFAATPDEVGALAQAGADFVAIGDALWDDARGAARAIKELAAQLALPEPVP